ncbi:DUF2790 domain-containing protein [Pseudomonas sp. SZMC_28357]|uniref:DUF2790 domain-containing protein n=1 Tax=Pseudomonas sp. SZMC_28357 TaxID=3074380 RepID=UPI0028725492|nr:DUF2790 domain-containing protein [Pseudomonas sp. SZMC_28357]MDR9749958.1 DUF2790 domain-containing protein [Pseudomonas sp. SZMC_28357]
MNWNKLIAASFFALLNVVAVSAHADVQHKPDIQKVLSIVDDGNGTCGIVNAKLTYLDSSGAQQVLDYQKFGQCINQGG